MRLFLAIELPAKVKKRLSDQINGLKKKYADFNWVYENNYHLTLHFFGEVANVEKIKERIETAVFDKFYFQLYSYKMGIFVRNKITIFLGFRREKKLEAIVKKIKEELMIFDSKKFVPHLTVARYRLPSKQQYFVIKKKLSQLKIDIDFPVKKIILFQSILTGKKPVYKKIASFALL